MAQLDKVYSIDYAWPLAEYDETKYTSFPYYQTQTRNMALEVSSLAILIDFEKESAVSIIPHSVSAITQDLQIQDK